MIDNMSDRPKIKFVFFGTGILAENVLQVLCQENFVPELLITTPNQKVGRGLIMKENSLVTFAKNKNLISWQPETLKNLDFRNTPLAGKDFDLFIIASYPKILSPALLNFPRFGCLNVHPSLLPKYRGPSPIQTALLNEERQTGVSIIKLDQEIDHGPILEQKEINILEEDTKETLEKKCGRLGGEMLAEIFTKSWRVNKNFTCREQDHSQATWTKKMEKVFGEIELEKTTAAELKNKFRALLPNIPIYFFISKGGKRMRVKVTEITLDKNSAKDKLAPAIIKKVIPENKAEISFEDFKRGYLK